MLTTWQLEHSVAGLCYDTTATNTGRHNGVVTRLNRRFGQFLNIPCRHHIFEILLNAAFKANFNMIGDVPDIRMFKPLLRHWTILNKTLINRWRNQNATLISKYERQLEIVHERNDNQELVELCAYYLGINTIEVRKLGSMSNSRWISKLLYSLKVYYRNLYLSLNDII